MDANLLFYLLIGIIILNFCIDGFIDFLNAKHFNDPIPKPLTDVYAKDEYLKSQEYKKVRYRFSRISTIFSLVLTLLFFILDGFAFVDNFARSYTENPIWISIIFFGIIMLGSDLLTTPFAYYSTFVIEEKYGFNKTNRKTFFLDKLKSWLLMALLGGAILALITWLYYKFPDNFWWYTWIVISIFSVFINMFYTTLIVPIFNKQTALAPGELRNKIEAYAKKVGFKLNRIMVIDGSKRSTKANAYFSGFGSTKQVTLYDTLINDLTEDEIIAVLAHEVGHYKKKHILYNLVAGIMTTGITLYIFSLLAGNPLLSEALHIDIPSFHIGLITFGILYTPISEVTGLLMNIMSRKFEYQADNYAKETFNSTALISGLKKLSQKSFSNLTPHSWYVFMHYSHPTLLQRMQNLKA